MSNPVERFVEEFFQSSPYHTCVGCFSLGSNSDSTIRTRIDSWISCTVRDSEYFFLREELNLLKICDDWCEFDSSYKQIPSMNIDETEVFIDYLLEKYNLERNVSYRLNRDAIIQRPVLPIEEWIQQWELFKL